MQASRQPCAVSKRGNGSKYSKKASEVVGCHVDVLTCWAVAAAATARTQPTNIRSRKCIVPSTEINWYLSRLLEQLAADEPAPNLRCAGADLVELGIAQQTPRRVVVDVAVAA